MATRIIDSLITVFSFKKGKGSDKELKEYQKAISDIRKKALLAGAAVTGFGIAAGKIVQGVDQQAKFARAVGISFENLRKFQFAAQKAGASTSELNSFVGNLARTIVSWQPGQFNNALVRLGVAARDAAGNIRPLDDVILDISNKLKGFNAIRRLQFTGQFGSGVNIANFLGQGAEAIGKDLQEAVASGFVIPERLTGQFAEFFDDSLLKLRSTVRGFSEVMIASLLPAVTSVVDGLEKWLLTNRELLASDIGGFLKGAGEAISFFGKGINTVLGGITKLVKMLPSTNSELKTAEIVGFAAASAIAALAAAAVLAAGGWIALGAAITAVISLMPRIKDLFSFLPDKLNFFKIPQKLQQLQQLSTPMSHDELRGFASSGGVTSAMVPVGATNNANSTTTQNNVFNISGAQSPSETARKVQEHLELATALQSASPGFNRPKVG